MIPDDIIAGIIRMLIRIKRKDFRFYFAKAYFENMYQDSDNINKAKFFVDGVKSYDKFL